MSRRPQFDESDIAEAGLRVARRRGWASVSVGSVAAELAVTPMALYRLARDAAHLKRIIADAAAEPLQPARNGEPLLPAMRSWAIDAYEHLTPLSGIASYVLHEWTELPSWLTIVDTFLAAAQDDGLAGTEAVMTVNAVFSYVLARAQLLESVTRKRRLQPLADQPGRFAHIRAELRDFSTARTEVAFRFGLEALCRGLSAARLTATRSTP